MAKRRKMILAGILLTLSLVTFLFFDIKKRNDEENKRYVATMDLWTINKNIDLLDGAARYLEFEKDDFRTPNISRYNELVRVYTDKKWVFIPSFKLTQDARISLNRVSYLNRNTPVRGEYINVDIYSLTDKGLKKETIDIFEKIRDFDADYTFDNFPNLYYSHDGRAYLGIALHKLKQEDRKLRLVFLDIQNQEIVDLDEFEKAIYTFGISEIFEKRLAEQGIDYNPLYRSVGLMLSQDGKEIETGTLEDSLLAKNYPEVYQGILDENEIYFTNMQEDPESILKVLELFFPKKSNLYEGITIPATVSYTHLRAHETS